MDRSFIACLMTLALPVIGAAPPAAPNVPTVADTANYQHLVDASRAVVAIKVKALPNARSNQTLGAERVGSGVLFGKQGRVLTIGYLFLEADQVEITTSQGRVVPAREIYTCRST